jgi:hypothetical protein
MNQAEGFYGFTISCEGKYLSSIQSMPAQKKTLTRHSTSEFGKKWLGNISHIETFLYFQIYQAPPHCQSRSAEDFRLL